MKAINFLRRYEVLCGRIDKLEQEIDDILTEGKSVSDNDGMPRGTKTSRPTEDKAIRLTDRRLKLEQLKLDAIAEREKIFDVIISIDGAEGDILYERYIKLKGWEQICADISYSWAHTHRIHKRALAKVQAIINMR